MHPDASYSSMPLHNPMSMLRPMPKQMMIPHMLQGFRPPVHMLPPGMARGFLGPPGKLMPPYRGMEEYIEQPPGMNCLSEESAPYRMPFAMQSQNADCDVVSQHMKSQHRADSIIPSNPMHMGFPRPIHHMIPPVRCIPSGMRPPIRPIPSMQHHMGQPGGPFPRPEIYWPKTLKRSSPNTHNPIFNDDNSSRDSHLSNTSSNGTESRFEKPSVLGGFGVTQQFNKGDIQRRDFVNANQNNENDTNSKESHFMQQQGELHPMNLGPFGPPLQNHGRSRFLPPLHHDNIDPITSGNNNRLTPYDTNRPSNGIINRTSIPHPMDISNLERPTFGSIRGRRSAPPMDTRRDPTGFSPMHTDPGKRLKVTSELTFPEAGGVSHDNDAIGSRNLDNWPVHSSDSIMGSRGPVRPPYMSYPPIGFPGRFPPRPLMGEMACRGFIDGRFPACQGSFGMAEGVIGREKSTCEQNDVTGLNRKNNNTPSAHDIPPQWEQDVNRKVCNPQVLNKMWPLTQAPVAACNYNSEDALRPPLTNDAMTYRMNMAKQHNIPAMYAHPQLSTDHTNQMGVNFPPKQETYVNRPNWDPPKKNHRFDVAQQQRGLLSHEPFGGVYCPHSTVDKQSEASTVICPTETSNKMTPAIVSDSFNHFANALMNESWQRQHPLPMFDIQQQMAFPQMIQPSFQPLAQTKTTENETHPSHTQQQLNQFLNINSTNQSLTSDLPQPQSFSPSTTDDAPIPNQSYSDSREWNIQVNTENKLNSTAESQDSLKQLYEDLGRLPPHFVEPHFHGWAQRWFYVDLNGKLQGPFNTLVMLKWFVGRHFPPTTYLRREDELEFRPIDDGDQLGAAGRMILERAQIELANSTSDKKQREPSKLELDFSTTYTLNRRDSSRGTTSRVDLASNPSNQSTSADVARPPPFNRLLDSLSHANRLSSQLRTQPYSAYIPHHTMDTARHSSSLDTKIQEGRKALAPLFNSAQKVQQGLTNRNKGFIHPQRRSGF